MNEFLTSSASFLFNLCFSICFLQRWANVHTESTESFFFTNDDPAFRRKKKRKKCHLVANPDVCNNNNKFNNL